jgi:nucleolar protein 56
MAMFVYVIGTDISYIDLINIEHFADRVIQLSEYRQKLHYYLIKKMHDVAPNLTSLIGEQVGARLISHAGSLTNLAKYPASTVQILGAEKALFRALKTRGNTPKYGLIFHSTFIGKASAKNKGRISRYLANKCSLAARIDSFSDAGQITNKFGEHLKTQVEDRLKFYDSGILPKKNVDVMKEAMEEIRQEGLSEIEKTPKTKKRSIKEGKLEKPTKKQKHHKKVENIPDISEKLSNNNLDNEASSEKKKKKKKANNSFSSEPPF